LLLNVVKAPTEALEGDDPPPQLVASQEVLREALTVSFHEGFAPEALTTIAPRPWEEIIRVARIHRCESLLLGFSNLTEKMLATDLEHLISGVKSDVAVLRARPGWKLSNVEKILVPVGGASGHHILRARLLGSLWRGGPKQVTFMRILPEDASDEAYGQARNRLLILARNEAHGETEIRLIRSSEPAIEVVKAAAETDLIILGIQQLAQKRKVFGSFALHIARETDCPLLMIGSRG
ncbi:MAG: universal stress protein, partial [Planctomycetota bacterium]|nr:universal stress protein [Planctomycetota bacterium]